MSDIFEMLEDIQKDVLVLKHPFRERELSFKELYFIGLGMFSAEEGKLCEVARERLTLIGSFLDLPDDSVQRILNESVTPDRNTLSQIIKTVDVLADQCVFLMDLFSIFLSDRIFVEREEKIFKSVKKMFVMTNEQSEFIDSILEKAVVGKMDSETDLVHNVINPFICIPIEKIPEGAGTQFFNALYDIYSKESYSLFAYFNIDLLRAWERDLFRTCRGDQLFRTKEISFNDYYDKYGDVREIKEYTDKYMVSILGYNNLNKTIKYTSYAVEESTVIKIKEEINTEIVAVQEAIKNAYC